MSTWRFYSLFLMFVVVSGCSPSGSIPTRDAGRDAFEGDAGNDSSMRDRGAPDFAPPPPPPCEAGTIVCDGNVAAECGVDGQTRQNPENCEGACNPGVGCGVCEIGGRFCDGTLSRICNEAGDGSFLGRDCAEFGASCGIDGFCTDPCADAERSNSYLGCEYWVPVLPNGAATQPAALLPPAAWRDAFDVRVVVGNAGDETANVTLTQGGAPLATQAVGAGESVDIPVPWSPVAHPTQSYEDQPIRLVSDRPVTVALFNPFEYNSATIPGRDGFSYSNDASLLFPAHTYQRRYIATAYTPLAPFAGFVGVVATQPTTVSVRAPVNIAAGGGVGGTIPLPLVPAGDVATYEMERGQLIVLQGADFSGARVEASAPVAVFSGTQCSNIPAGFVACDHIESQMPPIETWSDTYIGAPMGEVGAANRNPIRVYAAVDNTMVTITPAPAGEASFTLNGGEFREVLVGEGFVVEGSEPILVAQFLTGQQFTGGTRGDPAMTFLPPTSQYRTDYPFVAPTSYNPGTGGQNFVLLIREPGEAIVLDGTEVEPTWTAIGEFEWSIVPIDGGAHVLEGDTPFGAFSYGLGSFTSYAYPAGLDLEVEFIPPPVLL